MKNTKKILSIMLLLSLMLSLLLPLTVSAEENYTLSGTWIFDENIDSQTSSTNAYVDFTNSACSAGYDIEYLGSTYHQIRYMDDVLGNILVYDGNGSGWTSDSFRTVNFGSEPQTVSEAFYNWFIQHASRTDASPSGVIEDFSKDNSFDLSDFPHDSTDYSLRVVQIAESESGELFVYVYQPSDATRELEASYINMSTSHYENLTQNFQLYSLTLVDSYGTLDKYLVNDFTVSSDLYRYYNIATIYRPFDAEIDDNLAGDDDISSHKGYSVGKFIAAYNYNDSVKYEAKDVSVVDVEINSVGIVRYSEGYILKQEYCDSHFVAFSVNNYDVTDVFDATIIYTICDYSYSVGAGLDGTPHISNTQTITQDITEYQKGTNSSGGILGYTYEWPRIQTIDEFNDMLEDHTNERIVFDEGSLAEAQFVFNFLETDYSVSTGLGTSSFFSKRVTDVAILRLHFATATGTYNLGAVSDIVSDDGKPDFVVDTEDNIQNNLEELMELINSIFDFLDELYSIVLIIILVLGFVLFARFAKPIFTPIKQGFGEIFSIILAIILTPFELIASLFRNKRR